MTASEMICQIDSANEKLSKLDMLFNALETDIQQLRTENRLLRDVMTAAVKTLNDNGHLADGDQCSLFELREAVAKVNPHWELAR